MTDIIGSNICTVYIKFCSKKECRKSVTEIIYDITEENFPHLRKSFK